MSLAFFRFHRHLKMGNKMLYALCISDDGVCAEKWYVTSFSTEMHAHYLMIFIISNSQKFTKIISLALCQEKGQREKRYWNWKKYVAKERDREMNYIFVWQTKPKAIKLIISKSAKYQWLFHRIHTIMERVYKI